MTNASERPTHKHELGIREQMLLTIMRKQMVGLSQELDLDPMAVVAIMASMIGEYAALLDHLLKTKPEKFKRHYADAMFDKLTGKDLLDTLTLNAEFGYEQFKPRDEKAEAIADFETKLKAGADIKDVFDALERMMKR